MLPLIILKNWCLTFLMKYVLHYENLQLYPRQGLKLNKYTAYLKKNKSRTNGDKEKNALYKLMNNMVYSKTMENVRNGIDVKLVRNKEYLKLKSKLSYMTHKIFDNDLVSTRKNKVTLIFNKSRCVKM